jgi:hypothetical protein
MLSLRTLCLPLLGAALLALPGTTYTACAQTKPQPKVARKPSASSAAARKADPLRGTNGDNGYAAPGEPVNVTDNGKNTPSYDGPAPKGDARTKTTLASPK